MRMISELVEELSVMAYNIEKHDFAGNVSAKTIKRAADTIEALSAKLAAANMERSERYYGGGWIPCNERLPSKEECQKNDCRFIVTDGNRTYQGYFDYINMLFVGFNCNGTIKDKCAQYWMPLPEPYKPDGEVRK